ncbi:RNA polymerase sigma factor [Flavobacterium sp. JP2137]|uniref:RNA polymerase sigma factor n=1 Tax=Flavobacterium sp. JP2137 TaxID=3414510 RepID=UPI003D2FE3FC
MEEEALFIKRLIHPSTQEAAFRELVSRYKKPLYHHLRTLLLHHDDTDDVLQNTFIKIFRNIQNFKGESKLYSWMFRIATNEALTFLKQKAAKKQLSLDDLSEQLVHWIQEDALYTGDEIQLLLQKALITLPEKQQLVFKMKYFQQLDYQTISEILQTSVGALKASYHHAVKKIALFLKDH